MPLPLNINNSTSAVKKDPEDLELLLPAESPTDTQDLEGHSNDRTEHSSSSDMGLEEQAIKSEWRNGDGWAKNAALIGVATFVLSTWLIILTSEPGSMGWFAFHPPLQSLALACITYGILTLQPTSQPKTKAAGLRRHQTAIIILAVPLLTFGTLAIMYNKWLRSANHFTTWHGTLGLMCMLWLLIQIFIGAGSVWYGGALFGGGMKAKAVWKYHRMSGYVLFPLMLFTAHLGGVWSHWGENNIPGLIRLVIFTVAPAFILTGVYVRIRLSKMPVKFW